MSALNPYKQTNQELISPDEKLWDLSVVERVRAELDGINPLFIDLDGVLGHVRLSETNHIVGFDVNQDAIETIRYLEQQGIIPVLYTGQSLDYVRKINAFSQESITSLFGKRLITGENWRSPENKDDYATATVSLSQLFNNLPWWERLDCYTQEISKKYLLNFESDAENDYETRTVFSRSIQLLSPKALIIDDDPNYSLPFGRLDEFDPDNYTHYAIMPSSFHSDSQGSNYLQDTYYQPPFGNHYINKILQFYNLTPPV